MSSSTTSIQWTDATWNPTRGCSRVSEGCRNCYAERQGGRFMRPGMPYDGIVKWSSEGPRWTGNVVLVDESLDQPMRWKTPRRIFVDSMSDLFHEDLPDVAIDQIFAVMSLTPRHTFQVLTKRSARMAEYFRSTDTGIPRSEVVRYAMLRHLNAKGIERIAWPLPNVWLGVSVEDQKTADERIPILLDTPASKRFVSYEPALGPVDFERWLHDSDCAGVPRARPDEMHCSCSEPREVAPDWVIVGGESGPRSRPFDIGWARSTIGQCREAGVAVFVKQLGSNPHGQWVPGDDGSIFPPGDLRHSKDHSAAWSDLDDMPEDLRVREFPT